MKKSKKKGFTLVELLVVIAILAVLASVSVVGYLGFVKKSRISNDVSLTTQMNTVLAANEGVDGKNVTAYDAITELKEDGGFDVNKISPTTDGYYYAFDSKTNRMVLLDEKNNLIAPENVSISGHERDVFLLIGNEDEIKNDAKFSYYLKDGFTSDGTLDISTGLDVGENTNISTINYKNEGSAKNVIIRTSSASTNLTVEAPNDTMKHYGSLGTSTLTEISNSSFWEHGKTAFVELTKGRIVLTEDADVEIINVTKNDSGNGYNNPIIADGGVKEENMPSMISRDAVSVSGIDTDLVQIQKLDSDGKVTATEQVKSYSSGSTGSTVKNDTQNTNVDSALGGIVLDTENNAGGKALTQEAKETEKTNAVMQAESSESPKVEPVVDAVIYNSKSNKYYTETDPTKYEGVLNNAISDANAGDILYLFTDITTTGVITINKSIIFDGQDHKITSNSSATYGSNDVNTNIVNVTNLTSGIVTIRNINLVADKVQYTGVRVDNINNGNRNTNFTLNMNDVTIDVDNKTTQKKNGGYPIMIRGTANDIKVNLNNVVTKGWGGIQSTSNGVILTANNCTFNSINYLNDSGNYNSYNAIIVSHYFGEQEAGNSENNNFTFNNCSFTATYTSNAKQSIANVRSPYNNVLSFNGCKFTYMDKRYLKLCVSSTVSDYNKAYDKCSRVYMDGEDVTETADYFLRYTDNSGHTAD